jgi:hypothetical protein
MRRIAIAGTVTLALTLGACAAKQPPAPPALSLVTEAEPKPEAPPTPPTAEQVLAAQPPEVQEAIKEHDKSGDWPIYKTPAYTLYPYNQGPRRPSIASRCELQTFSCSRGRRSPMLRLVTASPGWQRPLPRETRETLCLISHLSHKLLASKSTSRSTPLSTSITCCSARAEATRCRRSSSTTPTS